MSRFQGKTILMSFTKKIQLPLYTFHTHFTVAAIDNAVSLF